MFHLHSFSKNLRAARKRQGFSQRELAEKLFISTQAVSKWERAEAAPDLEHVCRLSQLLHIRVDDLLDTCDSEDSALIAVDGGGTKTEFVLISLSGQLLHRIVLSGSNPNTVTLDGTCRILQHGIDLLLQKGHRVLGIHVGGAGFFSANNGIRVQERLRELYPGLRISCKSDICNVLACADDPDNAIAVICGTGSSVYVTKTGELLRCGGGGWRLETLGSGYDLGRSVLLAAMEHRDGTGTPTALTKVIEQKLGGKVWDKIDIIYAMDTANIASFAPFAIQAWQAGDEVAAAIVQANCHRVAALINLASEKSPSARQAILGGSLLTECLPFRQAVEALLAPKLETCTLQYPQVWGACLCCAVLAEVEKPDVSLFMKGYLQEE